MTAPDRHDWTEEVASEGGSFGNVEIDRDDQPMVGSESTETVRPTGTRETPVARDETGEGRRSP